LKITKEIKLALLGILSIVLFVFGFNYLKGSGMFSSGRTIKVEYDNVQGLTPSSYVQLQGLNVGNVKSISLSTAHPGKIVAELLVNKNVFIPADSKARIVSLDLLGTKAISIIKGNSTNNIAPNQLLAGDIELGTIDVLGAAATPAIDKVKTTLSTLDTTIRNINSILDVKTQENLKNTIANLNNTMKDFSQFAKEINDQRAKITSLLDNLNSFTANLDKNNQTITHVLTNAETTTANLSKLNFESTLNELKETLNSLQTTLDKVNHGTGSVAMLMNDDKLYKNLKNTLATANNLLYDFKARPSRYINVAIFGRKNKNDCPPQNAPNANE